MTRRLVDVSTMVRPVEWAGWVPGQVGAERTLCAHPSWESWDRSLAPRNPCPEHVLGFPRAVVERPFGTKADLGTKGSRFLNSEASQSRNLQDFSTKAALCSRGNVWITWKPSWGRCCALLRVRLRVALLMDAKPDLGSLSQLPVGVIVPSGILRLLLWPPLSPSKAPGPPTQAATHAPLLAGALFPSPPL